MLKASSVALVSLMAGLSLVSIGACSSNRPMVGSTVGSFADDSYLTSVVKAKLLGDTGLKAFHIHVTTKAQVVTLTGTVPTAALRAEAVQVAKGVGGVKGVVDNIQIGPNS